MMPLPHNELAEAEPDIGADSSRRPRHYNSISLSSFRSIHDNPIEDARLDESPHLAELPNISHIASITVGEDVSTQIAGSTCEREILEKKLPIATILIPFSIFGVLVRLGVTQLDTYTGAPVFPLSHVQLIGCVIMGFCLARKSRIMNSYLPLYVGLTTGLCGSITTFSSWELDIFQALSNFAEDNHTTGYNILAGLTQLIVTLALSVTGLSFGDHLANALWPENKDRPQLTTFKLTPRGYFDKDLDWKDLITIMVGVLAWAVPVVVAATLETQRRIVLATVFGPVGKFGTSKALYSKRCSVIRLYNLYYQPQGTLLRWYLSRFNMRYATFPLGTFLANMIGTAVLAVLVLLKTGIANDLVSCEVVQGLEDGFCGCLTTISTFTAEITTLRRRSAYSYAAISIVVGQVLMFVILGTFVWTQGIHQTCPW
ncbi:CrcB-like protein-domain-containing protein [Endogone sp. FLAS-F59071]|nr:CrcB-like protein-domain-containing protein [Endogone sp. FLAS-F59071]|eukprot:RUS21971.1 CrcB-like protein-domain-containing protein [Endogone sp. FLAS-F59071]